MNNLEKSILATISYFDIFDYPLTLMEIWKWLMVEQDEKVNISQVQTALDDSELLKNKLAVKNGFYFIKGRQEIVKMRMDRYRIAEQKFVKAKRIIKILRLVPFVKMVAVCNTLAFNNSRPEADIDLFIITSRRRVWQVRWWVTGFLKIFDLRPRLGKTRDTLCPSFFTDEDNLDLQKLRIDNDIYLLYWVSQVFPVYDDGVYEEFIQANSWLKEKIPNWLCVKPTARRQVKQLDWLKKLYSVFFMLFPERIFKKQQMRIMPANLKKMANQDSRVIIQDYMLKFHDNDRREFFLKRWEQRKTEII
ncbi:hypothetical protein KKF61_04400 [Patescibacteria group bacterium]|nr:hypothetical protein [Patescibacteria group bacterium]MBU0963583.1 hypothetical protein [Patescibacteria group bacterium]